MRKISHVQYDIEYDIVWTTKYRYKVLKKRYWGDNIYGQLDTFAEVWEI